MSETGWLASKFDFTIRDKRHVLPISASWTPSSECQISFIYIQPLSPITLSIDSNVQPK
ncbi:hypothetical protein VCRA2121O262_340035 [Vibrio crassostreae]|nr:hypothetical protein VCRA2121O262_340035 [Vibrio crassostreae]